MSGNLKFNLDECFHAINQFLSFTQLLDKYKNNLQSLDEIINYHLDHKYKGALSNLTFMEDVANIKEICDTKNQTTQSNLISALTAVCYTYSPYTRIDAITSACTPAQIMASFHREALIHQNSPMQFIARLNELSKLSPQQLKTILFCIKSFAPDVVIDGNFVRGPDVQSHQAQFNNIIDCLTTKVAFTYTNKCLGVMKNEERNIFLASVRKATSLVLDATDLNKWSANDWEQFINAVEQNKQLNSISLKRNDLCQPCAHPEKFPHILKLFKFRHLEKLKLNNNFLEKLPTDQFQQLIEAISETSIPKIDFKTSSGSASTNGLFAINKPDQKTIEHIKKEKESDTSKSGEFEFRM